MFLSGGCSMTQCQYIRQKHFFYILLIIFYLYYTLYFFLYIDHWVIEHPPHTERLATYLVIAGSIKKLNG